MCAARHISKPRFDGLLFPSSPIPPIIPKPSLSSAPNPPPPLQEDLEKLLKGVCCKARGLKLSYYAVTDRILKTVANVQGT